jgi:RpiR family transcriptional regulator, carbohydrate utilization regulator
MYDKDELPDLENIPYKCALSIRAVYDNLKTAEKKAVNYIISNPSLIADLTIEECAKKAGCSEATIVRLSKRLGYRGFPQLKKDFAENKIGNDYLGYEEIEKDDDPFIVFKKVFESSISAINDTSSIIDKLEFKKALDALLHAKKIMFCGVGDAALVAMEAYQRFTRIGMHCLTHTDPDLQLVQTLQLEKGDVLIAISYSGRSKTVVGTVKNAKASGAVIITLTNYPVSPLTKKSDIILQTAAFSRYSTGEIISKRITQLLIIESLYINFILSKGPSAIDTLKKSNEIIMNNKL